MNDSENKKTDHKDAEKKRRDAIKKGYDMLLSVLPGIEGKNSRSEAFVFEICVNYLNSLENENTKLKDIASAHGIDFNV